MIKNKYELASKPERDRIIGNSFIGSYGPFPVHNVKFNKLVQYLEKINNNSRVSDESESQKAIQDTIKMQLNLSRLKILNDYALKEKEAGFGSDVLAGLSFRNWCGMSSPIYDNIKNDLDDPNRMFAIDRICRDHDIRYTKGQTQEDLKEADNIMMKEIFNEYVVNFNKNFLTGDYKSDFTTWTSSFKTIFNYLMTLVETGYVGYVLKNTAQTTYELLKAPYKYITASSPLPELTDYLLPAGTYTRAPPPTRSEQIRNAIRLNERFKYTLGKSSISNVLKGIKSNALSLGITFIATNIIKDRLLALGSLAMISLKKGFETLTGYQVVDLTKHDVSDEDLENMKQVFEQLLNQYLQESGLDPIKIGDEWTKEQIEVPPIKEIEEDIKIIAEQNKTYNELNKTMVEAMPPAPVIEPSSEPIEKEIITSLEPLTEEELIRLNEYKKFNLYLEKIFNEDNFIITPYPDLPSTDTVKEKEKLAPDIEKDIKEATPSSLLDLPDEENIDDEKNKQNEINNQEENDEKNKTEL